MILGVTGHRPQKLYGYDINAPGNVFVIYAIGDFLKAYKPDKVITGMAIGVDQFAAQWCVKLNIPFIAAVSFAGQESAWLEEARKKYKWLLTKAEEVVIVSNGQVKINDAMNRRNEYIVDHCDTMLGVFGGYAGGTRNCLEYAQKKNKEISIINPGDYYKTRTL
jgi:uncharacterized phage-like protein YoqJ